jgi:citrate synthase
VERAIEQPTLARVLLVSLGARPTARNERAMNRALVLLADHELNASSFTARVAASAGADLYACVSAGLATLSGPRHGGIGARVEALLAEVGRPERARLVIQDRAQRGDEIPGFGHPLYPDGDPRAPPLLESAAALAPRSLALRTLFALVQAMREAGRPLPTVDVALAAIGSALGLSRGAAVAIFAVGRTAGWIAHAFEQREAGYLLRPRARYVGP